MNNIAQQTGWEEEPVKYFEILERTFMFKQQKHAQPHRPLEQVACLKHIPGKKRVNATWKNHDPWSTSAPAAARSNKKLPFCHVSSHARTIQANMGIVNRVCTCDSSPS